MEFVVPRKITSYWLGFKKIMTLIWTIIILIYFDLIGDWCWLLWQLINFPWMGVLNHSIL